MDKNEIEKKTSLFVDLVGLSTQMLEASRSIATVYPDSDNAIELKCAAKMVAAWAREVCIEIEKDKIWKRKIFRIKRQRT